METTARQRNREALATVLRRARKGCEISQAEMAEHLGVSLRSISGWERNEAEPPTTVVLEWLRICDVPIDRLLGACAPWDSNPEPADYGMSLAGALSAAA